MYGANVIIFEGILTFYNVDVLKVRKRINLKLLIDDTKAVKILT